MTSNGADDVTILATIAPPDGYQFVRGLWSTHDCNAEVLTDLLLPALTATHSEDARRRRIESRAAFAESQAHLAVFAAADRVSEGSSAPGLDVYKIGPRRLHAKFALLQYQHQSGTTIKTRAIITSANLTRGGLISNREVVVWDGDITQQTKSPRVAKNLVVCFESLVDELGDSDLRSLLQEVRRSIKATKTRDVCETITAYSPALLDQLHLRGVAARVVIVSPAFGGASAEVDVPALAAMIGARTAVDIYCGGGELPPGDEPAPPEYRPAFSPAAVEWLRDRAQQVRIWAIPERQADESGHHTDRPLHAKLFAAVDSRGAAHVLVGSANFTKPGLDGGNRELMARVELTEAALVKQIEELGARRCADAVRPPERPCAPADVVLNATSSLHARFVPDPGQFASDKRWGGDLFLVGLDGIDRLRYLDQPLNCVTMQRLELREEVWYLTATTAAGDESVSISVDAEEGFWLRIEPPDDHPSADEELAALLFDLGARPTAVVVPGLGLVPPEGARSGSLGGDDVYRIPLDQRLVVMARKRRQLRGYLQWDDVVPILEKYLGPQAERQVGSALLSTYVGATDPVATDPLLTSLQHALRVLDSGHAEEP
jgi:hypothetical protein